MTLPEISRLICVGQNVTFDEVCSKSRDAHLVFARHLIWYFGYKWTKHSNSYIGQYLGGRNHAAVIYARKSINNYITTDRGKRAIIEQYEEALLDIDRGKGLPGRVRRLEEKNREIEGRVKELENKMIAVEKNIDTFVKEMKL